MSTYAIVLFLHVLAATTLIGGGMVGMTLVRAGARRAHTYQELRTILALAAPLRVINPAAALALLGTGVYLATLLDWWSLGWVQVGLVLWAVSVLVAARVVGPHVGRLAREAARNEGPLSDATERLRWAARWTVGSGVLITNDAAVLLLMVLKPSLGPALLMVMAAHALHLGVLALDAAWKSRARRGRMALQH